MKLESIRMELIYIVFLFVFFITRGVFRNKVNRISLNYSLNLNYEEITVPTDIKLHIFPRQKVRILSKRATPLRHPQKKK